MTYRAFRTTHAMKSPETPDEALLRLGANRAMVRCVAGETAAFEEVYAYLAPRLFRTLLRRTRDPHRAEDLLQQAIFQLYRFRTTFEPDRDVLRWAHGIARHLFVDECRRRQRDPLTFSVVDETALPHTPWAGDADYAARELATRFQAVFAALPGSQRKAFELLRLDGLSHEEAAHRMGTTVSSVKLRAHRAYAVLRSVLRERTDQKSPHGSPLRGSRHPVSEISRAGMER